ncbi:thioredoxin-like protein [Pilobolus umbonatus]|nr:thioredoxin-like protein [Pilobolus umbonatus]
MEDALWSKLQNTSPDDSDKERIEDDSDQEENKTEEKSTVSFTSRTKGPQTGPKGVRADYAYQQQQEKIVEAEQRREYNARVLSQAPMTTTYREDEDNKKRELILEYKEMSSDEEEEAFMKEYREKKLRELKENNHVIRQRHKVFGTVSTVNADEYVTSIDQEWKTVPVIVHLFDERIPKCRLLDNYLVELSQKYALAKFIRVSAVELDFDLVESPAILAYQHGQLVANLVRLVDEVGSRFDIDAVEDVLLRHRALSENDQYEMIHHDSSEDED